MSHIICNCNNSVRIVVAVNVIQEIQSGNKVKA